MKKALQYLVDPNSTALDWSWSLMLLYVPLGLLFPTSSVIGFVFLFHMLVMLSSRGVKWEDVLGNDDFMLVEKKTGKSREIKINDQLQRHITDCHSQIKPHDLSNHIFLSQKSTVFSIQTINIIDRKVPRHTGFISLPDHTGIHIQTGQPPFPVHPGINAN